MADDIKFVIGVDDRDLIKAQKEQLKFQRNLLTIETAYRKGDITAKRYNAELNKQTRELQKLGGTYKQASSEVRKFAYQLRTADDAALAASTSYALAGKNVNRMGMRMQQAGYQIGDFAVQVQGGTNVMVALGQQGAQLLGIFGAGGAIAGAALAITTALIAPLFQASKEAKEASNSVKALEGDIDNLKTSLIEYAKVKKAVSMGITVEELTGKDAIAAAKETLDLAKQALQTAEEAALAIAQGGGIDISRLWKDPEGDVDKAKKAVEDAEKLLADTSARIRQEAREKAESEMLAAFEKSNQARAQAEYEAGQKILAETEAWVKEAANIFNTAQKRMRDEEVARTELSLQRLFQNRTLMYSIRFSGDSDVMSQSLTPSSKKMKPTQSYTELVDMGWTKEDLSRIGMSAPKKTGGGGGGAKESPQEKLAKYLQGKQQELTLEKQLVGVFDEERKIQSELFKIQNDYKGVITESQAKELEGTLRQIEAERQRQVVLGEVRADQQRLQDTITSSMEDGFMAMIDGTKSVKDAFKEMAAAIIKELLYVMVVKKAVSAVTGFFGFADGGAFSGGSEVKAYADGGVVGGPTTFPMAGGKTGLMGEAGPEAIMPLKRGANGKLGVQMEGGGGDTINVVQNFSFQANGDDSVKKIIAQAAPQIAQMTKSSLLNDRRRGGATKAAFG